MANVHLVENQTLWMFYKLPPFEYQKSGFIDDINNLTFLIILPTS
jgi:hypothetical protein